MDPAAQVTFSLPLLALGLVLGLFGWVLYWGGLTALGALLGAGMGVGLGTGIAALLNWSNSAAMVSLIVGGLVGAVFGAVLLRTFHRLFFFLCGIAVGSVVVQYLLTLAIQMESAWASDDLNQIMIRSIAALVGGLLLVALSRFVIIILTSFFGMLLVVAAWPADYMMLAAPFIWLAMILLQYVVARRLNLFRRIPRYNVKELEDDED